MQQALSAHRRGAIADAKRLYDRLLSIDPSNAAACGNLAIIAAQQGDLATAERLMRQEIRLRPNYSVSYNNLGAVLQQQGRGDSRRTGTFVPDFADRMIVPACAAPRTRIHDAPWLGQGMRNGLFNRHKPCFILTEDRGLRMQHAEKTWTRGH